MSEDLGKITGYHLSLSPTKGNTLQFGAVFVNDFEKAWCDVDLKGNTVVTHVENVK